ncbi:MULTISPECIES: TIGR03943 family putative permease subunit [Neobacillus]|uniref:TIGR03943 family protein n=1 Tax=Neobacillus rhizophilus TaxID=2833579 RepID=A0A942UA73_9BACI|nr:MULTISPECIES: TIGR03943 family protein [Neobacillus]MBS4215231.1 TIGR03943 family protein [Neobacillus rhizophilus]MBU8919357.1 TIGR03943 family protein [Bacillus sp. FJAT-29953]
MFRVVILLLFTNLFFYLHLSGNISKYINMKYSFLSYSMIYALFFLTIVEGIRWYLKEKKSEKQLECVECHHDHAHEHDHDHKKPSFGKKLKRTVSYTMIILPALTGVFLPVATLDSQLVNAKGFSFPTLEDGADRYGMHQILNPDMSKFMGQDAFTELVKKEFKSYKGNDHITLTDEDYLKGLEVIYNYSGEFVGKTVTMKGFSYNGPGLNGNQIFLFRFGIIHCIADSGVFGMMIQFPENVHIPNDQWYEVTGTVDTMYYQPFKMKIPILKVTDYKIIEQPKDAYVYRNSF